MTNKGTYADFMRVSRLEDMNGYEMLGLYRSNDWDIDTTMAIVKTIIGIYVTWVYISEIIKKL